MGTCSKCGASLNNAEFCSYCGARAETVGMQQTVYLPTRKKGRGAIIAVLAAVLILTAGAGGAYYYLHKANAAQYVTAPDLRGLSFENAEWLCNERGLTPILEAYDNSATVAAGRVIEQSLAPGVLVDLGSEIAVIVSLGAPQTHEPEPTNAPPVNTGKAVYIESLKMAIDLEDAASYAFGTDDVLPLLTASQAWEIEVNRIYDILQNELPEVEALALSDIWDNWFDYRERKVKEAAAEYTDETEIMFASHYESMRLAKIMTYELIDYYFDGIVPPSYQ